jgi:isopentenyldiphosphate isomerase
MSFLDHIKRCNNACLDAFAPWFIGGERAGFLHREFAPVVASRTHLFARHGTTWHLDPILDTPDKRTAAMHRFLLELREQGHFEDQWRDEAYPVAWNFTRTPLMAMERAAVPWFGVRAFGPHMTGYVCRKDGLHIWVPRRSYTKPTFPGQLDNTLAGGQPIGIGLHDNLIKECAEEAAIPRALAMQARAVSFISYLNQSGAELKPDLMICFDLELPENFTPHANDGEVHSFELWPVQRVFETVRDTTEFKYNCNLVLIDFFVRHGLLRADDPQFVAIVSGLKMMYTLPNGIG